MPSENRITLKFKNDDLLIVKKHMMSGNRSDLNNNLYIHHHYEGEIIIFELAVSYGHEQYFMNFISSTNGGSLSA